MENQYKKLVIYYFSGTGNAKNTAIWISNIAEKNGIKTNVINISKLEKRKDISNPENALIGFCCPTHGFNFPPIMFHFILRFPKTKQNSCFIINTRAGMKAGKLFLPGLSGMAQYSTAIILWLKGFKIKATYPVDLPSNWISFHPGIKEKAVKSIYTKRKEQVEDFAQDLFEGKRNFKGLYTIIIDLLITPIAFLYYIVGRFVLAKSFYASKDCTKCDVCIKQCPVQAIKTIDKRPFWTYKCESCMHCMNICPERAIETSHGYTIGMYYLITSFLVIKFNKLFYINDFLDNLFPEWLSNTFDFFINSISIVLLIIGFYRIFHFLLRFRFFERLVVYTSLTKWKFWRRYKSPKILN